MCHSFTWWCSWITHFIKIFQCVLLSKATFLGGGGEGSGDCLMQNLPWKSWGTSHDWRQDLHSDSLMHFTLWWHCMLHSSWKRAYIRSLSSFFLSLIFFFFYSHIRSQEGTHLWRGVNFATWEGRFGYLPWDDSLNHLSYLRKSPVLKVFCLAVEWPQRSAPWLHPGSWLLVEILCVSYSAIFLMLGVRKWILTPDFNLPISPSYLLPWHVREHMYVWYAPHLTRGTQNNLNSALESSIYLL